MKNLILVVAVPAMFVFGYFVMTRLDEFIEKNQRRIVKTPAFSHRCVRIVAEKAALLDFAGSALDACPCKVPYAESFFGSGKTTGGFLTTFNGLQVESEEEEFYTLKCGYCNYLG